MTKRRSKRACRLVGNERRGGVGEVGKEDGEEEKSDENLSYTEGEREGESEAEGKERLPASWASEAIFGWRNVATVTSRMDSPQPAGR